MPTVIHGDFEWDADKADLNLKSHGVSFEEAALAMRDPLSVDFDDLERPENVVTLATSATGAILYMVSTDRGQRIRSSAPAKQRLMSDESTKKATSETEPTAASLAEMPEINDTRFRRRAGRGHHAARSVGEIVAIDTDLWPHFGSQRAVNDALRSLVEKSQGR